MSPEQPLDRYLRALRDADGERATDVVLGLLDAGSPVSAIVRDVLVPAQETVGQLWEQGAWTVADEHAATAITESAVAALARAGRFEDAGGRHVLMACAEGEWHGLPLRLAALVASAAGQRVTYLGGSLPADQLRCRLAAGDVDLLAISCTLTPNLVGVRGYVAEAHSLGVPVVVGGRAFGGLAHRAAAVGADALVEDVEDLAVLRVTAASGAPVLPEEVSWLHAVEPVELGPALPLLLPLLVTDSERPGRAREELRWLLRCTAAAVLTHDRGVLDEQVAWALRRSESRLTLEGVVRALALLAASVDGPAPTGARLLRETAAALAPPQRAAPDVELISRAGSDSAARG